MTPAEVAEELDRLASLTGTIQPDNLATCLLTLAAELRNALARPRADYYVYDTDGRRVPLVEALEALGLMTDGGK